MRVVYISSIKGFPDKLFSKQIAPEENQRLIKIMNKAEVAMQRLRQREGRLHDGDKVRIRMDAIFSNYRQKVKAKESKNLPVKFSPILFEVTGIKPPRGAFGRFKYVLHNHSGHDLIRDKDGKTVYFKYTDLLKADEAENDVLDMNMDDALRLCKVKETSTDLKWE
ncbi:MAG: hypothetical protein EOP48_21350 [Sphingobacteriales bacterium]|nr:MAG: hypothetical protein EOP48_21350 [Sphingobacteriales bacterium]